MGAFELRKTNEVMTDFRRREERLHGVKRAPMAMEPANVLAACQETDTD